MGNFCKVCGSFVPEGIHIPEKVKVGGFDYRVERVSGSFVSNGAALDGEHYFAEKTIKAGTNGCKEYQDLVFLHELCHAIISCYTPQEKQNEEFVEQFSKGLYQVLKDNPEILRGEQDGNG